MRKKQQPDTLSLVRCAIYTRKSTEEGLAQDFNSLDAQREACEAYILSQQGLGWACLPDRFDDGGFTGANTERPALQRLLRDINVGKIDCVLVYKVDRLSRSLIDFAGLMKTFEEKGVSFVSVTQQMNTGSSMGRLMLNVLLSFAQFEREIISERTRDKIAATKRKGKWCGGRTCLGYDLDRERSKLVVNEDEAIRVRAIFDLYLQHQALLPVVKELEQRDWRNKVHISKQGEQSGGTPFNKTNVHYLLTNVLYLGKVRYKDEIHEGEHPAIIDEKVWQKTQRILQRNAANGGAGARNKHGFLLKGILRCDACDRAMIPSFTTKRGERRYRYYVCNFATKYGWAKCPTKSIPAGQIEDLVVERIKCIGQDPAVLHQTLAEARKQDEVRLSELQSEKRQIENDLRRGHEELRNLSGRASAFESEPIIDQMADLQERLTNLEQRALKVKEHLHALRSRAIDEDEVAEAMRMFDPVWQELAPHEQARIIQLLVECVGYDGSDGTLKITFHPSGIQALTQEILDNHQEQSA